MRDRHCIHTTPSKGYFSFPFQTFWPPRGRQRQVTQSFGSRGCTMAQIVCFPVSHLLCLGCPDQPKYPPANALVPEIDPVTATSTSLLLILRIRRSSAPHLAPSKIHPLRNLLSFSQCTLLVHRSPYTEPLPTPFLNAHDFIY